MSINCTFLFTANLYITMVLFIEDMKIIFSTYRYKTSNAWVHSWLNLIFLYGTFPGVNKHTYLNTIGSQYAKINEELSFSQFLHC